MVGQTLSAALDELEQALTEQLQALRDGDADALPAVGRCVQERLAQVMRTAGRQRFPAQLRPRLVALMQRARASEAALLRRQQQIEGALHMLSAHSPALQELQARRVYGGTGRLAAGMWRSGGFERV